MKYFLCFVFSLMLSLYLSSLPVDAFYDRDNYLRYMELSSVILENYFYYRGVFYLIFNEPVWLVVNIFFGSLFSDVELSLRALIFTSSFITFLFVTIKESKYLFFIFLIILLPQVLKNNIVHLRQGVALSFFIIGWYISKPSLKLAFMSFAALIHLSFLFLLFIYLIFIYSPRIGLSRNVVLCVCMFVFVFVSFFSLEMAVYLGSRQGERYSDVASSVSGFAFLFWSFVFSLYLMQGRLFIRNNFFSLLVILFYLSAYFFLPVSGRIFESAILFVLVSGLNLTSYRKLAFIGAFLIYFSMQWWVRLGSPLLGWSV